MSVDYILKCDPHLELLRVQEDKFEDNVTHLWSLVICTAQQHGFGHIYWRNTKWETSFFVQWWWRLPHFLFKLELKNIYTSGSTNSVEEETKILNIDWFNLYLGPYVTKLIISTLKLHHMFRWMLLFSQKNV